ncbi:guanine nucleotide exchange factor for Rab-3A isoform X4 [Leptonychotes weddellii]|uniref:Guanine nucleotide exchange factor for Rab-3A isoform X4 n=1 Tax=Leptonychotes weddellii TaxID=9713 RepID=A0A7F8QHK1_LEPWE|nr:guanine nucleotide exchange factor for Rab-3A isoform X4 [Leptonychotes weddellii]
MRPVLAPRRPRVWSLCPWDNPVIASQVVSLSCRRGPDQAQSGRHVAQGGSLSSDLGLGTPPWICCLPRSQPHPDEGHPPPLEAVPVPWKSVGPCKSHRESPRGLAETPGGEEGPAAAQLDVLRLRSSSMEIREKGSEFLKEELHKAQKELKLKDEECERLSKVREQLERELEELTASLFEEAHKMVREANMKQAASEKQLKEARGKIDMLQAEVSALKTLVLTSTPASPNRELHPQLLSPTKAGPRKGHLRHKSTGSTLCPAVCPAAGHTLTLDKEGKEVDTTLFAEFQAWRESPTLDKTCPFLERVYREDVGPCLDFTMQELSALVRAAVEDNTLTIEPVASQSLPTMTVATVECGSTNTCALSGLARACRHRIRLGDSESHYYISPSSRARAPASQLRLWPQTFEKVLRPDSSGGFNEASGNPSFPRHLPSGPGWVSGPQAGG